jgi:hypothetical protein
MATSATTATGTAIAAASAPLDIPDFFEGDCVGEFVAEEEEDDDDDPVVVVNEADVDPEELELVATPA